MAEKKILSEEFVIQNLKMKKMMGLLNEDTYQKELKRVKDNAAKEQQVEERENTPDAPESNPGEEKMASGGKVKDGTTQQVEERENTPDAPEAKPAEEKKAVNESEEVVAEEEVSEEAETVAEEEVSEEAETVAEEEVSEEEAVNENKDFSELITLLKEAHDKAGASKVKELLSNIKK